METLSPTLSTKISFIPSNKLPIKTSSLKLPNRININKNPYKTLPLSSSSSTKTTTKATSSPLKSTTFTSSSNSNHHHWVVVMEKPPEEVNSKLEIIDYYVKTLESVLGSEEDAQMCIYDVSCDTHFGFCCNIDAQTSQKLAGLPGVVSVRPHLDYNSKQEDYTVSDTLSSPNGSTWLFPPGSTKHWLVRMDKPGVGVVTKAQMVDYYTQILTKVMGNEKDAQMCIYHVSWQSNFGFCCELDEECEKELAGVPGVLSVHPDTNVASENKDYRGEGSADLSNSEASQTTPTKTKKLFVTGLSFYTSEKTLREAFEGFGELVEVKIIMDKISKRSKGYGFVEYTTEDAASAALREMNGKIINGWMIVVDAARSNPPKYSRGRPRP